MTNPTPSVAEITAKAITLLCRQIGPANTARFLNQFHGGIGNYTDDRSDILGDSTVDELIAEMKFQRDKSVGRTVGEAGLEPPVR